VCERERGGGGVGGERINGKTERDLRRRNRQRGKEKEREKEREGEREKE